MLRKAYDFVDNIQRLNSANAIMDAMGTALHQFGVDNYLFTFNPLATETFADVIMASRLPAGLCSAYEELDLVHHDPGFRHAQTTLRPFRWFKDAPYDPEAEPLAQRAVDTCREFGLVEGVVIPVATSARRLGQVWFGGPALDVPKRDEAALHLMALYAFDRVLRVKDADVDSNFISLTAREREALTHVALGKNTEEIADLLSIAQRTVNEHINQCRRKLGASTRAHAVMLAMRQRMIQP